MQKTSPQTKSFIILLTIALVGTYVCLILYNRIVNPGSEFSYYPLPKGYEQVLYSQRSNPKTATVISEPVVDTSLWKDYSNKTYNFSFKYKPGWKVLPTKKVKGFDVVQIDPGSKFYNFKVYVSQKEFYVMDGLPLADATIGGLPAKEISGVLYGVKNDPYFYTFDIGYSLSLKPEFDAMVNSVSFSQ